MTTHEILQAARSGPLRPGHRRHGAEKRRPAGHAAQLERHTAAILAANRQDMDATRGTSAR